jgi:hypothetical protein
MAKLVEQRGDAKLTDLFLPLKPAGRIGAMLRKDPGSEAGISPTPRISRVRVPARSAAAMEPAGERSRGADFAHRPRTPPRNGCTPTATGIWARAPTGTEK